MPKMEWNKKNLMDLLEAYSQKRMLLEYYDKAGKKGSKEFKALQTEVNEFFTDYISELVSEHGNNTKEKQQFIKACNDCFNTLTIQNGEEVLDVKDKLKGQLNPNGEKYGDDKQFEDKVFEEKAVRLVKNSDSMIMKAALNSLVSIVYMKGQSEKDIEEYGKIGVVTAEYIENQIKDEELQKKFILGYRAGDKYDAKENEMMKGGESKEEHQKRIEAEKAYQKKVKAFIEQEKVSDTEKDIEAVYTSFNNSSLMYGELCNILKDLDKESVLRDYEADEVISSIEEYLKVDSLNANAVKVAKNRMILKTYNYLQSPLKELSEKNGALKINAMVNILSIADPENELLKTYDRDMLKRQVDAYYLLEELKKTESEKHIDSEEYTNLVSNIGKLIQADVTNEDAINNAINAVVHSANDYAQRNRFDKDVSFGPKRVEVINNILNTVKPDHKIVFLYNEEFIQKQYAMKELLDKLKATDSRIHSNSKEYEAVIKELENFVTSDSYSISQRNEANNRLAIAAENYLKDKWKDRSTDAGETRFTAIMDALNEIDREKCDSLQGELNKLRLENGLELKDFGYYKQDGVKVKQNFYANDLIERLNSYRDKLKDARSAFSNSDRYNNIIKAIDTALKSPVNSLEKNYLEVVQRTNEYIELKNQQKENGATLDDTSSSKLKVCNSFIKDSAEILEPMKINVLAAEKEASDARIKAYTEKFKAAMNDAIEKYQYYGNLEKQGFVKEAKEGISKQDDYFKEITAGVWEGAGKNKEMKEGFCRAIDEFRDENCIARGKEILQIKNKIAEMSDKKDDAYIEAKAVDIAKKSMLNIRMEALNTIVGPVAMGSDDDAFQERILRINLITMNEIDAKFKDKPDMKRFFMLGSKSGEKYDTSNLPEEEVKREKAIRKSIVYNDIEKDYLKYFSENSKDHGEIVSIMSEYNSSVKENERFTDDFSEVYHAAEKFSGTDLVNRESYTAAKDEFVKNAYDYLNNKWKGDMSPVERKQFEMSMGILRLADPDKCLEVQNKINDKRKENGLEDMAFKTGNKKGQTYPGFDNSQMKTVLSDYKKELSNAASFFKNSPEYDKLRESVDNALKAPAEDLVKKFDEVMSNTKDYIKLKNGKQLDSTSQNKVRLCESFEATYGEWFGIRKNDEKLIIEKQNEKPVLSDEKEKDLSFLEELNNAGKAQKGVKKAADKKKEKLMDKSQDKTNDKTKDESKGNVMGKY